MSGLQINITPAGRAALVNADNTGTAPTRVTQIGITSSANGLVGGALDGELKRLSTFAGAAVAGDTVHVTIRDDSADVYAMRGFALYLEDGTLLAWYAQAGVILEKSAQAMMLLAADIRFVEIDATSLEFGDTNWINPPGTETVPGVVQFATDAVIAAGADNTRAIHSRGLKALLDSRFGEGAPSGFVKGLLSIATAALLRAALELKGAALKDEGDGNGLDADKLDGQHGAYYRDYANLTNVPGAFPPTAHSHAWASIIDPPATATRWPTYAEVTGKPATFPPSAHTHAIADVNGLATELAGKALANHSHVPLDAGGRLSVTAATITDWNNAIETGTYMAAGAANAPDPASWWIGQVVQHNASWAVQTVWKFADDHRVIYRRRKASGTWSAWERCRWHESDLDARYGVLNANVAFADITASRGDGTGVIFLNAAKTRYLYFDGGSYLMPGAGLVLGAGIFAPSSNYQPGVPDAAGLQTSGSYGGGLTLRDGNYRASMWTASGNSVLFGVGTSNSMTTLLTTTTSGSTAVGGFQPASSRELKNLDGPLPYGLDEVLRIETVIGSYKPEYCNDGERKRFFIVAEQLREVMSEPVFEDRVDFEGKLLPAVDYDQLVPVLIRAIQELSAQVRDLQART